MPLIDRKTIDLVYQAIDIVDVVGEFVSLRKSGSNYKGLCPFHDEKTPSFIVTPSKGICHCFGCHKGGNAINFLMQLNNWSYPEAIRWLAKKYNIEINEVEANPQQKLEQKHREELFTLNQWANTFFQQQLHDTPEGQGIGLSYFRSRGFRDDIIAKFQLGYCPSSRREMYATAQASHLSIDNLVELGLLISPDNGKPYDRFHSRVMFPVFNHLGKVVAFGGRIMEKRENTSKYVNSPESPIYSKSRELYGLFQARNAIQQNDCCYLVEGYTDVISMHQCGVQNVVASSGTALTHDQIRLIRKYTSNLTVLYDGDNAGIKASLRGIDMLLEHGLNIKVLLLPDGHDPDSFARSHTAEEFADYVREKQTDFIRFKTNLLLNSGDTDIHNRSLIINGIAESIARIENPITRSLYIQECAQLTQIREDNIIETVNATRNKLQLQKLNERQHTAQVSAPTPATDTPKPEPTRKEPLSQQGLAELNLIKYVVRFGEKPIEENSPTSFAQYIRSGLQADSITLLSPLYMKIIDIVCENQTLPGFNATNYLLSCPEDDVRALTLSLSSDTDSAIAVGYDSIIAQLKQNADKLLINLSIAILQDKINHSSRQLHSGTLSDEQIFQTMKEIQDLKQAQTFLKQQIKNTSF